MGLPVNLDRKDDPEAIHVEVGVDILCSPHDAKYVLEELPTWLNGLKERMEKKIGVADHKKWRVLTTLKSREEDRGVRVLSEEWDGLFSFLGIGRVR